MPCINAGEIIDYIYVHIYFAFIIFKKCKALRNGHNYLFIVEFMKKTNSMKFE